MLHLTGEGILALAALFALLAHSAASSPVAAGDFWQEVREWLIAAGTVGAVLVALLLGPYRRWWNRPQLKLSFDRDDQMASGLFETVDPRLDGLWPAAFARLKASNHGRSVAEGVEALVEFVGPAVVAVAPGASTQDGVGTIVALTALSDLTLAVSNTREPDSTMVLPAGTSRHFDLANLFRGQEKPGPLVLCFSPEPLDDRHVLDDSVDSVDMTVVLVARNAAPTRYVVSVPRYRGTWPISASPIWEDLSVASLAKIGWFSRLGKGIVARMPWSGGKG
jgi:hypothetical protein